MPRKARHPVGDVVYHVLNRANSRQTVFRTRGDYEAFEKTMAEAAERTPIRIIDYCVMPTHWHMVLWPWQDGDLSRFVGWLSMTHAQRWHAAHETVGTGHLYQGRFKDFPVQSDRHVLVVRRYVQRNPLRAGLVQRAEDWLYSSLHVRMNGDEQQRAILSDGPVPLPADWLSIVNEQQPETETEALRRSVRRGCPYGDDGWVERAATEFNRAHTLHPPGRPVRARR